MTALTVYVPKPGSFPYVAIDRGSGIVGAPVTMEAGGVILYFEGNRYGYANVKTFADRVAVAAGRLQENYPTLARLVVNPKDVIPVATFNGQSVEIDAGEPGDLAFPEKLIALAEWCGWSDEMDTTDLTWELLTTTERTRA